MDTRKISLVAATIFSVAVFAPFLSEQIGTVTTTACVIVVTASCAAVVWLLEKREQQGERK